MKTKKYDLWLHRLPGIGDVTIGKLLNRYGSSKKVYEACVEDTPELMGVLRETIRNKDKITDVIKAGKEADIDAEYKKLEEKGIRFITWDDPGYPLRLHGISGKPFGIYCIGKLPEDNIPCVAIIGARNCSEYGRYVARKFGACMGKAGINVVSGMAIGVDGLGQSGAIDAGGATYAVLGSGVDVCYPTENMALYERIPQTGGILSTFPSGTAPVRSNFPIRNKLVAALCDAVLVVEAKQRSGTGITVGLALSMNKDVYAVPGRITDRLSDGCNMLLRQGAGVAISPEDFVSEVKMLWARQGKTPMKLNHNITNFENSNDRHCMNDKVCGEKDEEILKYTDINPLSTEQIHNRRLADTPGIDISDTIAELSMLCIEGKLIQVGSGFFYRPLS